MPRTSPAAKLRCRLGKHVWMSSGRGNALTYTCRVCGVTRETAPRSKWGATEAPVPPGGAGPMY